MGAKEKKKEGGKRVGRICWDEGKGDGVRNSGLIRRKKYKKFSDKNSPKIWSDFFSFPIIVYLSSYIFDFLIFRFYLCV
jgi:hypothetical protein